MLKDIEVWWSGEVETLQCSSMFLNGRNEGPSGHLLDCYEDCSGYWWVRSLRFASTWILIGQSRLTCLGQRLGEWSGVSLNRWLLRKWTRFSLLWAQSIVYWIRARTVTHDRAQATMIWSLWSTSVLKKVRGHFLLKASSLNSTDHSLSSPFCEILLGKWLVCSWWEPERII